MQPESVPADWTKLEKIRFLLDNWDLIHDPDITSGSPGDGSGVALMPLMSRHQSVIELGRTLGLLLWANPGDYRHLIAFRQCEWRGVSATVKVRGPRGKPVEVEQRQRQRVLPRWLNMQRVRAGEAFLEAKFQGDVNIPDELYHALTCTDPWCRKCWPSMVAA